MPDTIGIKGSTFEADGGIDHLRLRLGLGLGLRLGNNRGVFVTRTRTHCEDGTTYDGCQSEKSVCFHNCFCF